MLALRYSDEIGGLDLVKSGDGYAEDETTATLVYTSVFTDLRATDLVGTEARGYWADPLLGSSIWQILGKPQSSSRQQELRLEAARSLSWLDDANRMTVLRVDVEAVGSSVNLAVELGRGSKVEVVKWGREAGLYGA